ncbi:hypothetical protein BHE74_00008133 [Ensete ventricosum]|nr:hypothetical protein GW17_00057017 [Ensete ventricosum]RWW83358.1 hypothetical protein BHE74_00008133 [Ensete ventricosum]
MGYVHIDDVASCHILVYENDNAQGRYLCSSNVLDNHEVAAQLANRYPSLPIPNRLVLFTGSFHNYCAEIPRYQFDTSKLRDLGFKFKGIEEMFDDCITSLRTQGYQI